MINHQVAAELRRYAMELQAQGENLYRIRAVRRAVMMVLEATEPLPDLLARLGSEAWRARLGLGASLGNTIEHYLQTGEWAPAGTPVMAGQVTSSRRPAVERMATEPSRSSDRRVRPWVPPSVACSS